MVCCAGTPWYRLCFGSLLGEVLGAEGCQGAVGSREDGVSFTLALAESQGSAAA